MWFKSVPRSARACAGPVSGQARMVKDLLCCGKVSVVKLMDRYSPLVVSNFTLRLFDVMRGIKSPNSMLILSNFTCPKKGKA